MVGMMLADAPASAAVDAHNDRRRLNFGGGQSRNDDPPATHLLVLHLAAPLTR